MHCEDFLANGEMTFSKDGTKLALATYANGRVELFDFNRCDGSLHNYQEIDSDVNFRPYGCEFSKDGSKMYVTDVGISPGNGIRLYQYNLMRNNVALSKRLIWSDNSNFLTAGQLQIGPNNKIYLSVAYDAFPVNTYNVYLQNLGVINQPDSLGLLCNFQPFVFYLGDSSRTYLGLPNMPNYNLGPLSIYEASAGEDQVICTEDTLTKGVFIGAKAIEGVQYSWTPENSLSDPTSSRPLAFPSKTTMYIVTFSDTSIKYSCQTRTDTVVVEVKDCSVGVEESRNHEIEISIYPNPTSGIIHIKIEQGQIETVELWDLSGQKLQNTQHDNTIDISNCASAMYILCITLENGATIYRKVIKD